MVEKLDTAKMEKVLAASPLSLSIFWAKKKTIIGRVPLRCTQFRGTVSQPTQPISTQPNGCHIEVTQRCYFKFQIRSSVLEFTPDNKLILLEN